MLLVKRHVPRNIVGACPTSLLQNKSKREAEADPELGKLAYRIRWHKGHRLLYVTIWVVEKIPESVALTIHTSA